MPEKQEKKMNYLLQKQGRNKPFHNTVWQKNLMTHLSTPEVNYEKKTITFNYKLPFGFLINSVTLISQR